MSEQTNEPAGGTRPARLARGVLSIVLAGLALGLGFNALGQRSRPSWGLTWIATDRITEMVALEDLAQPIGQAAPGDGYSGSSDPMAVGGGSGGAGVPQIPLLDRPIEIRLEAVARLFEHDAAAFIDAREPDEYAAGHIPRAISMPYDAVSAEPERLEQFDAGGKPIVVYCGGGNCELSLSLAWDLIYAGQQRVVVYMGGFPEWEQAGQPVETGARGGP